MFQESEPNSTRPGIAIDSDAPTPRISRRTMLRVVGAGSLVGLAGCIGQDNGNGGDGNGGGDGGDDGTPTQPQMRTVTDDAGRTVEVPQEVDRIVAIGTGALRQVVYVGAADRVVGVEEGEQNDRQAGLAPYNEANPRFEDLPIIGPTGPAAGGDAELIISVQPDVIFFVGDPARADELTAQTGAPVVILNRLLDIPNEQAREKLYATWRLVGEVVNNQERVETLVEYVKGLVADLRTRTEDIPAGERAKAYVGAVQFKGGQGLTTTRKPFPPFDLAGVEHVAKDLQTDAASVQVSREKLLKWNPETMFVDGEGTELVQQDIRTNSELRNIAAIANGDVYTLLPYAQYNFNAGSVFANAYYIGKTMYPERFADVSMESKTDEIFQQFVDAPLYDRMREQFDVFEPLEIPE